MKANRNFIKHWRLGTEKEYKLHLAICATLFEFFPHLTIGYQPNKFCYGGKHAFIEFGWLIFHGKLIRVCYSE